MHAWFTPLHPPPNPQRVQHISLSNRGLALGGARLDLQQNRRDTPRPPSTLVTGAGSLEAPAKPWEAVGAGTLLDSGSTEPTHLQNTQLVTKQDETRETLGHSNAFRIQTARAGLSYGRERTSEDGRSWDTPCNGGSQKSSSHGRDTHQGPQRAPRRHSGAHCLRLQPAV